MSQRPVKVIGVASGLGAQDQGTADGPQVLRKLKVFQGTPEHAVWNGMLRPGKHYATPLAAITDLNNRLAREVQHTLAAGEFPLIIGGDHSCAIGAWSAVHAALHGPLGMIWIDAHMDSHTFATTPTGAVHGMPLACLLGHGEPDLTELMGSGPKLRPEHVCLLGVRSYEEGEALLLKQLGVRVITMAEVRQRGTADALQEALAIARNGTAGFGISIDLDALDPGEIPGVGSPEPGGIQLHEMETALRQLHADPALLAMEIVEYNPHRDRDQLTAKAAGALFRAALDA